MAVEMSKDQKNFGVKLILKVFPGVGFRVLCRPLEFLYTILSKFKVPVKHYTCSMSPATRAVIRAADSINTLNLLGFDNSKVLQCKVMHVNKIVWKCKYP